MLELTISSIADSSGSAALVLMPTFCADEFVNSKRANKSENRKGDVVFIKWILID